MKGSNDEDDDNFRCPPEPGTSFKIHGGKRRGSVRKRKHEEGYDKVSLLSYGKRSRCTRIFTTNG